MLAPRSRPCVATALTLYSEILDRIEAIDFAVFSQRATVGTARRLQVAGGALIEPGGPVAAARRRTRHGSLAVPDRARRLPG